MNKSASHHPIAASRARSALESQEHQRRRMVEAGILASSRAYRLYTICERKKRCRAGPKALRPDSA